MAARITALILTLLANVAAGVIVFFFMLLAMNGFHESDANWGLMTYIALAVGVTLLMSIGAFFLVRVLTTKKQLNDVVAALISVPVFSVLGAGLKVICSVIGVLVADFVRVNY